MKRRKALLLGVGVPAGKSRQHRGRRGDQVNKQNGQIGAKDKMNGFQHRVSV